MLVWACVAAAFGPDEDAGRTLFCCRRGAFGLAKLTVPPADTGAGTALAVRGTAASAVLEAIAATLSWYSLPSDVSSTHTSELSSVPFEGGALVLISAGYTTVTLAPAATLKPNRNVCPAAHVVKPAPSQAAPSDNSFAATVVFAGTVAVSNTECNAAAVFETVTAYRTRCPGAAGSGVATARMFSTVSVALPTPVVNPACASTTCVVGLRNAASAAN